MTVRIEILRGAEMRPLLWEVARLRTTIFREWPYVYDGSLDYEERYLSEFASSEEALLVAALDGQTVVGVATAAPLPAHTPAFPPLFEAAGFDPSVVFYFGESVLLPGWRGCGIGHQFFDVREAEAMRLGRFAMTAFCAVSRPQDDPRQPSAYRSLDPFWRKRGYEPIEGLVGSYAWREVGGTDETEHLMQFWGRSLRTNG